MKIPLLLATSLLFFSGMLFGKGKDDSLQIKVLKGLNFGVIKSLGVRGTITVSANSPPLISTTGGVYAVSPQKQKPTRLKLKGQANTQVFLNVQNRTVLVSEQGKTLDLDLELNSSLRHLGPSGVITDVFIGGTLNVDANPAAGDYRGDFTITVDYQ